MLTQGIPNLNKVYEDDIGVVVDHFWEGKHVIHSELKVPPTMEVLKHARDVSDAIDVAYAGRGINKLYTWASNDVEDRYNRFLGFVPTGVAFETGGSVQYREYEKDLTV